MLLYIDLMLTLDVPAFGTSPGDIINFFLSRKSLILHDVSDNAHPYTVLFCAHNARRVIDLGDPAPHPKLK